jgi:hypothetical protein
VIAEAMSLYSGIYPNTLHDKWIFIGGGLIIVYQLDAYERWIVHVRYILSGNKFEDLFCEVVGKAGEGWLDNHFEDNWNVHGGSPRHAETPLEL